MKSNLFLPIPRALFVVIALLGLLGAAAGGAAASTNPKHARVLAAVKKTPKPTALISADCKASVLNALVSSHLGVSVTFSSVGKVAISGGVKTKGCFASENGFGSV